MPLKTAHNIFAWLLLQTGITAPSRRARGHLSIATFHRVLPETERRAYPLPGLAVTPEELNAFLTYFMQHFDCGPLARQHERFLQNETTEHPLLAITFDDAQHDNYQYARPILAHHQIKASFFAPVHAVQTGELLWHDRLCFSVQALLHGTRDEQENLSQTLVRAKLHLPQTRHLMLEIMQAAKTLPLEQRLQLVENLMSAAEITQFPKFALPMTFDELAELAAAGHEIGSHSMTHSLMTECDDNTLAYEINESRHILQSRIKQAIDTFCYPNGNADRRTALAVAAAGYRRAVTTRWGNNSKKTDPFLLRRYDMDAKRVQNARGDFMPALLAFRMSGLYPGLR
jgi:peptidoglycan/xylan/chitin deacetylase (PgdA/CDA1 family)